MAERDPASLISPEIRPNIPLAKTCIPSQSSMAAVCYLVCAQALSSRLQVRDRLLLPPENTSSSSSRYCTILGICIPCAAHMVKLLALLCMFTGAPCRCRFKSHDSSTNPAMTTLTNFSQFCSIKRRRHPWMPLHCCPPFPSFCQTQAVVPFLPAFEKTHVVTTVLFLRLTAH